MSTETMTPKTTPDSSTTPVAAPGKGVNANTKAANLDPQIQAIINKARTASISSRATWMLAGLSAVLLWATFTPLNWSVLGWVALVPSMMLIRPVQRTRWTYRATFLLSFVGYISILQWMRLGDPLMYFALFGLALYLSVYMTMFVMMSRAAVHRLQLPFAVAVPMVWVGLEFLRGFLMTGFPWYFLSHSQYRWTSLIQISDLTGTYGISFLMAATAAVLTALLPESVFHKLKMLSRTVERPHPEEVQSQQSLLATPSRPFVMVMAHLGLFGLVLGYGYYRLSETEFVPGPRVALVQGNFPSSLKHDPRQFQQIFDMHYYLTGQTVQYQPDLIVWPETMYRYPLMTADTSLTEDERLRLAPMVPADRWNDKTVPEMLEGLSSQSGAALVIGIDSRRLDEERMHAYNSAVCISPLEGIKGIYDKNHRVVFGEYIPFQDELLKGNMVSPTTGGMGIDAGIEPFFFAHDEWNFAPLICYEDTVPTLVRDFVKTGIDEEKPVDCLVNLTNDGWFHGSSELDQHLITSAFRCVETRTPMVRAVNTGISVVIDSQGVIRSEPEVFQTVELENRETKTEMHASIIDPKTGSWFKQVNGILIDQVPLDKRTSPYLYYGDWFAMICLGLVLISLVAACWPRQKLVPAPVRK
ncbi:Apolipoprotein N-acyltransferase [Polystyrenella longa]|uniref:Apolipoprotein N-acyltransferase n=1 Tax=Polystyrenella longa TaxID=2528007 RepID=A0A518CRR7_9PLAN|nr:apolipoprotein N-acyltransferase [Polystyrenella longa]QDU81908.1 Apolipoprotein N-acyltransferase [Polystyrenella longa]